MIVPNRTFLVRITRRHAQKKYFFVWIVLHCCIDLFFFFCTKLPPFSFFQNVWRQFRNLKEIFSKVVHLISLFWTSFCLFHFQNNSFFCFDVCLLFFVQYFLAPSSATQSNHASYSELFSLTFHFQAKFHFQCLLFMAFNFLHFFIKRFNFFWVLFAQFLDQFSHVVAFCDCSKLHVSCQSELLVDAHRKHIFQYIHN